MSIYPTTISFPRTSKGMPIDVNCYEHCQSFSDEELLALQSLALHRVGKAYERWRPGKSVVLDHIAQPIIDVLTVLDGPATTNNLAIKLHTTVTLLLREMYHRNKTLWSLEERDWQEILCPAYKVFEQRYKINGGLRATILIIAYLLGGFTAFHHLGLYRPQRLARRVFGETEINAASQRILTLLQSSGYSPQNTENILACLCEAL